MYFIPVVIFAFVISIVYWSARNGISPMPSTRKQREAMISLLPVDLRGKIADVGSGWGTLAIALARRFRDCNVTGYENSPIPLYTSKLIGKIAGVPNLEFKREDFVRIDLQNFDAIVCYLHPAAMKKLQSKLDAQLRPGTPVICNSFALPGWQPEEVLILKDIYRTRIYLYHKLSALS
jgi:2-polyprenyl-3-methyl-5-hydroxy-6-metoxy-1,4-benzoquinol methylase